ncbi:hypothetical protein KKF04_00035 [Patescibacteria group bacterium]|nr:hypothetical protein [Patescibacteria group bacterium]MBU1934422.1 hypothetical protein [Patescibacteria group bacterium]
MTKDKRRKILHKVKPKRQMPKESKAKFCFCFQGQAFLTDLISERSLPKKENKKTNGKSRWQKEHRSILRSKLRRTKVNQQPRAKEAKSQIFVFIFKGRLFSLIKLIIKEHIFF